MKSFQRYTWFIFGMVFLVILAGGVVRMTQSGMGCPDWPKCFGRWIPPTDVSQLPADFEKYLSKQDIDHTFNAYHTWIEYINRLLGALLGLFLIPYAIWAVKLFWKKQRTISFLAIGLLLLTGFQGFLGKLVVDENLAVSKITIHMLVALLIAAIPLIITKKLNPERTKLKRNDYYLIILSLLLVTIQIILGTDVREQIDIISKSYQYQQRELWISKLEGLFFIHRSFSWILLVVIGYLGFRGSKFHSLRKISTLTVGFLLISILLGLLMYYLDIPSIAQPLHLISASALAMSLLYFVLCVEKE